MTHPLDSTLRISELDFQSIKDNLKEFMREHADWADFDFEGSNWNALLDLLAYNTHYMSFYLNMVASENFLDSAQLRDSIISHAKALNYVPTSKIAATAYVNIEVTPQSPEDTSIQTLTLQKFTKLIGDSDDGRAYGFVTTETDTAIKANSKFTFNHIQLKQGEGVTYQRNFSLVDNPKRRINIPSANVDITTLSVIVQKSAILNDFEIYDRSEDLTEVTANSAVYYVEENPDSNGSFCITFGDGFLGKTPPNNSIIILSCVDTFGSDGNSLNNFTMIDSVGGFSANIKVTSFSASAGGAEKESIEDIRFRAPLWYTSQNRAVTVKDYEILLPKEFPNIQAISVWGGEENDPPIYGKVFISLLPKEGYHITTQEKERIKEGIISNHSILTVIPEIVDPELLYIMVKAIVRYDETKTSLDEDQLKALIRAEILSYKDDDLADFSSVFRESSLSKRIGHVDSSILGTELEIKVQKRIEIIPHTEQNYTIDFGTELQPGGIFDRITTYPSMMVYDLNGTERALKFEEKANTLTGITSVSVLSGGSGYKTNPTVTITGDGQGATANATIVNGSVYSVNIVDVGTGYTQADIEFESDTGQGATAQAFLEVDRATLLSFYYSANGRKVTFREDAGQVRYDLGKVTITNLEINSTEINDIYSLDVLTVVALPKSSTIATSRNKIITIDENDSSAIDITMIKE